MALTFNPFTNKLDIVGSGGAASSTTRSDYVTSPTPYIYIGRAPTGTPESTASWTIKRSETDSAGLILNTLTATGAWTNRYSLTYT
jgi:hypothetical protein